MQAAKSLRQAGHRTQALDALRKARDHAVARTDIARINQLFAAWRADQISRIPDEVLAMILAEIDSTTLARLQTVCSRWHRVINMNRSLWRVFRTEDLQTNPLANRKTYQRAATLAKKSCDSLSWVQIQYAQGLRWSNLAPCLGPSCSTISRLEVGCCNDPGLYLSALQFAQTCANLIHLDVQGRTCLYATDFDSYSFCNGSFTKNVFDVFVVSPLPNDTLFDDRLLSSLCRVQKLQWTRRAARTNHFADGDVADDDDDDDGPLHIRSWIWTLMSMACSQLRFLDIDLPASGDVPRGLSLELRLLETLSMRGLFNNSVAHAAGSELRAPALTTYKSRGGGVDSVLMQSAASTLHNVTLTDFSDAKIETLRPVLSTCSAVQKLQIFPATRLLVSLLGGKVHGSAIYPYPNLQQLELSIRSEDTSAECEVTGGSIVDVICRRQGIQRKRQRSTAPSAFSRGAARPTSSQSDAGAAEAATPQMAPLQTLEIADQGEKLAKDSLQVLACIVPNFIHRKG